MAIPAPAAPPEQRILLGIGFMLLACTVLPAMNGVVQWLSPRYPSEQLVWARIMGQLVIMLAIMLPANGLGVLATRQLGLQFARSVAQLASTALYFTALTMLPLAKAAVIGFTGPFLVALMAWPLLGERLKLGRMMAVAVAFAGVLVVIRPGGESFHPASLLVLAGAVTNALYQVLTRKVAAHDRTETCVLWSALVGAVALTFLVPFFWVTPQGLADWFGHVAIGAMATAGHYFLVRAFANGPAAVISPFYYWQIVSASLVGVAVTGLWPESATWSGAAIIIAAGVYLAISEGRRR